MAARWFRGEVSIMMHGDSDAAHAEFVMERILKEAIGAHDPQILKSVVHDFDEEND